MELNFTDQTVAFLKCTIHETLMQEQTQEVIVPDSFPDAGQILITNAFALLRTQECRSGNLQLTGAVRASCLYTPEDDSAPRVLDSYLPFTMRLDHPAAAETTRYLLDLRVRSADARLINSRKLLLRIGLGCQIDGYEEAEETFFRIQDPPEALQLRTETFPLQLPAETAQKPFSMTEEPELGAAKPAVSQIVYFTAQPVLMDRRLNGTKAVFKGNLLLKVLYLAEDGSLNVFSDSLPFSQYMELQEDYMQQTGLQIRLVMTGCDLEVEAGSEGRKLMLTADILSQCVVTRAQPVTVYSDAYTTEGTLKPEWKEYRLRFSLDNQELSQSVRDSVSASVRGVADAVFYLDFPQTGRNANGLVLTAPVNCNLLYMDENGQLRGLTEKTEAKTEIALNPDAQAEVADRSSGEGYASPGSGGADLRYDMVFEIETFAKESLRSLSGGSLEESGEAAQNSACVILRRARSAQSVWEIAKEYASTVEAIMKANQLESEEVEAGDLLLIPT